MNKEPVLGAYGGQTGRAGTCLECRKTASPESDELGEGHQQHERGTRGTGGAGAQPQRTTFSGGSAPIRGEDKCLSARVQNGAQEGQQGSGVLYKSGKRTRHRPLRCAGQDKGAHVCVCACVGGGCHLRRSPQPVEGL